MLADPNWFNYSLSLLDGSLDRHDESQFCQKMEAVFNYVASKSQGRCTSKSIFDAGKREAMQRAFQLI